MIKMNSFPHILLGLYLVFFKVCLSGYQANNNSILGIVIFYGNEQIHMWQIIPANLPKGQLKWYWSVELVYYCH